MPLFIDETDDLRTAIGLPRNFTTTPVLPYLDEVERDVLPTFLGQDLTEQLIALADDSTLEEGSPQWRALRLARNAVGRLGFHSYLPFAEVQITDIGIAVSAGPNEKPAFEYQTKKLERALLDTGWKAFDNLITLISAAHTEFPGWADAPIKQELEEALFQNADHFSEFYPIQGRWLTFHALRPFIRTIEEDRGAEALERLNEALADTDSQYPKLYRKLLRALALESILMAVPHLAIEINGANVQVNYASQYSNISYYQPPSREMLDWVIGNLQKQADNAWLGFENSLVALNPPPANESSTGEVGSIFNDKIVML